MEQPPETPANDPQDPRHEAERDNPRPQIYIASLADYSAGRLHGAWVDAAQEPDELAADADAILKTSSEPWAEEYAIHDYEGFGPLRLGEYESLETVSLIANGIAEHGPAFAHWAALIEERTPEELDRFDEAYLGHHDTVVDYAETMLDDLGVTSELEAAVPEGLRAYVRIDIEMLARDMQLSLELMTSEGDGGVYIFQGGW